MTEKKPKLDDTTIQIMRRLLNTPPKPHDEMKVGRHTARKQKGAKGPSVSGKRRTASRTVGE
jgi:hypothetical protein